MPASSPSRVEMNGLRPPLTTFRLDDMLNIAKNVSIAKQYKSKVKPQSCNSGVLFRLIVAVVSV